MKFKNILAGILLITSPAMLHAQAAPERVITLKECLRLSIENSPRLKINTLEQDKLKYQYREVVGTGLPHINFNGGFDDYVNLPTQLIPGEFFGRPGEMIPVQFGTTYNLSGSLDLSQIIYNQTYLVGMRMAKLAMDQNRLESERVRTELVFDVAQSFYYAQISRQQIMNLKDNLSKLEKAEQIARSQYENGLIKKVDVDRIVVNKLNVQTAIDRMQVTYEQQLNMQRYFMGLDLNQPVLFPDSIGTSGIDLSARADLGNHIDIRMIEKQKQLALTNVRFKQSEFYPSLNLIGSVNYLNQSNTYYVFGKSTDWFNTSFVGVRLNVPIFNGMQRRNRVNQSKINLDQLKVTEDNTLRILNVTAKDAANRLVNAINDEQRQRQNMKLAERVYEISQDQYQKGVISLTDLLNAESGLSDARTNHSLALVQMKIAELEYMKANGTLLGIVDR
jgi:outer membrane protein TolC